MLRFLLGQFSRRRRYSSILFKYILTLICTLNLFLWIYFVVKNNLIQGNIKVKLNNNSIQHIFLKDILTNITWTGEEENKIINEKKRVEEENTDEFLVDVLRKCKYIEVDLKQRRTNDFNNYDEEITEDTKKIVSNLGNNGTMAIVPKSKEEMAAESIKTEGFNSFLSDMITLSRNVPDGREEACKHVEYDRELPDASIVITFNNEILSTLLRTIHSVMNNSPIHLIKEIILVDDFSDKKDLKGKLERYLATIFLPKKVRLVKLNKRAGLIQARMIGAHLAIGKVIVFLDSHCEIGHSWLEPLLHRIKNERTAVACPVIETIDSITLEYKSGNDGHFFLIGFNWNGHFTWIDIPEHEEKRKASHHSPTRSPMMIGGVFAIDRKYFWEIGSYDSEMKFWGGENLEMSFRIWQCGGSIEIIPCSRIGHIFRRTHPYIPTMTESHDLNIVRLAEVWMDDYKEYFYKYNEHLKSANYGDVSKRLELRKRLNCKNFEWYLDNIYKEKFRLEKDSIFYGQIKNDESSQCLDNLMNGDYNYYENYTLSTYPCHMLANITKFTQTYYLSKSGELRREYVCAASRSKENQTWIGMSKCDQLSNEEKIWEYKESTLQHLASKTCMTILSSHGMWNLTLEKCDGKLSSQQWKFIIV